MRFWDTSAVIGLLVTQPQSEQSLSLYQSDPEMVVWWACRTECESALARLEREQAFTDDGAERAFQRLDALRVCWHEIMPKEVLRVQARRLLRTHPLRAADALQLASAIDLADGRPDTTTMCCFDGRLRQAAQKEGFVVV